MELMSVYSSIKLAIAIVWSFGFVQAAVYVTIFTYVLWIGFGHMMALQRAREANSLTLTAKILGYPLLAIFIVMDAIFNFVICTITFVEFPKIINWSAFKFKRENWQFTWACFKSKFNNEWLATQRLERYIYHTEWPKRPETTEQWFKMILLLYWLNSWRKSFADFLASNLLDPLAPDGKHCRP